MAGPIDPTADRAPGLHGTRAEAIYRLKVGVGGLLGVLLVVAVASSILQRARDAEDPETQVAQEQKPESASDPLVDIGVAPGLPGEQQIVVPDLPAEQMPPDAGSADMSSPSGPGADE